jgi:hypothetical protein
MVQTEKMFSPYNQKQDKNVHSSTLLCHIVLEVLASEINQDKTLTSMLIREEVIKLSVFADSITMCIEKHKDSIQKIYSNEAWPSRTQNMQARTANRQ